MNLFERVKEIIKISAIKNTANIHALKIFNDVEECKEKNAYDYLPSWNQSRFLKEEENPLNLDFVNETTEQIFEQIFGSELSDISFDLKGHVSSVHGHTLEEVDIKYAQKPNFRLSVEGIKNHLKQDVFLSLVEYVFFDKDMLHINIKGNTFLRVSEGSSCPNCDAPLYISFDAETMRFSPQKNLSECPKVDSVMSFSLSVPSKKLVFVNELRHVFETKRKDEYEISSSSLLGMIKDNEMYLMNNIAYITLSSGGIEILKQQEMKKIALDFDKKTYYVKNNAGDLEPCEGVKIVGEVSLELWGCFILDSADYEKLCLEKNKAPKSLNPVYVDIESEKIDFTYDIPQLLLEGKY